MPLNKDAVRVIFIQAAMEPIQKDPKLAIDLMKQKCPEKWAALVKKIWSATEA